MSNAIIFVRHGLPESVEEQQALCAAVSASNGLAVTETRIYTGRSLRKRFSGSWALTKRGQPELSAAITAVCRGDRLVTAHPDCLDTEAMAAVSVSYAVQASGGDVLFANAAHPSNLSFKMAATVFAQHHQTVKALTRAPVSRTPLPGQRVWRGGTVPFGYKLARDGSRRMLPVPEEQKIIDRMCELKNSGLSLRGVAKALAKEGIFPPRGGARWQPNSVSRALNRRAADIKELEEHEENKTAGGS